MGWLRPTVITSILLFLQASLSAEVIRDDSTHRYVEAQIGIGSLVPNYRNHPNFSVLFGGEITIGKQGFQNSSLNQFYRQANTGISLGIHTAGNDSIYGQYLTLQPIIEFPLKNEWSIKGGLGLSYFNSSYRQNEFNKSVGSRANWNFQVYIRKGLDLSSQYRLKVGGGFVHSSNGHVQLPNYGLNTLLVSLSLQKTNGTLPAWSNEKLDISTRKGKGTFSVTTGIGLHEFGGTTGPVRGKKYPIYANSIRFGRVYRNHIHISTGIGWRYYTSFAEAIEEDDFLQFRNVDPNNVYAILGIEIRSNHLGIQLDGGINIHKPYYPYFARRFGEKRGFSYPMKRLILNRFGINYYLIKLEKNPSHNVRFGAFVSANFGQADFAEVNLTYIFTR